MKTRNLKRISVLIIISLLLYSCPPTPELPGDIEGIVTDAETSEPVYQAKVGLNTTDDTTSTGIDGTYWLKNIDPDNYVIQASKFGYAMKSENVRVESAMTKTINFSLAKIPIMNVSTDSLDFGLDSTSLKFNISKTGTGELNYRILASQNWITVSGDDGEVTGETEADIITITIDRTGLEEMIYKETITVTQFNGLEEIQKDALDVYLNGIWIDSKYVFILRIGTQVWMGENLNVGTRIEVDKDQTDNQVIEKYCYNGSENNCNEYGGLYQWNEMMQYNQADTTEIGTTQGICPEGWHIPTGAEWDVLLSYVGGDVGKLKETGTAHWNAPNVGATNETGFTALPGGMRGLSDEVGGTISKYIGLGISGIWWTSSYCCAEFATPFEIVYDNSPGAPISFYWNGQSVRCIRNP